MSHRGDAAMIVETDTGSVRGVADEGIARWLGIPFARPPVGALRWRPPQAALPWIGIRDASAYANDPMQVPVDIDAAPIGTIPSEDCLYVNVWRAQGPAHGLPVLVWIYGGGFVNGGSSPPTYSGARLAGGGIVVVSLNYRVGRFGTFAHPQLTAEAEAKDEGLLGNYGVLDQIAALRWIQRNVAAFGGDPTNVTLVGESAGAGSIHMLMTSPLASGLFHKAVIMSGGTGDVWNQGALEDIETLGQIFASHHGIAAIDPEALAKLRALSSAEVAGDLNLLSMTSHRPFTFAGPFVDGKVVVNPATAYTAGNFNHVPMVIGATSNDMDGPTGYMVAGARSFANRMATMGIHAYHYRFSYVAEHLANDPAQIDGATHASEIPFFLATQRVKYGSLTTRADDRVGALASEYLVSFAISGEPRAVRGPAWPRWRADGYGVLFDFSPGGAIVRSDPLESVLAGLPEPVNPNFFAEGRKSPWPD